MAAKVSTFFSGDGYFHRFTPPILQFWKLDHEDSSFQYRPSTLGIHNAVERHGPVKSSILPFYTMVTERSLRCRRFALHTLDTKISLVNGQKDVTAVDAGQFNAHVTRWCMAS